MNTIPERIVERTWSRVNDATSEDVQAMTERMIAEQPFIGAYLMAVEEVWMPAQERGGLLLLGLIVWQVMSGQARLRTVTSEEIESAEADNIQFVERLEDGSEMELTDALGSLATTYNQAPLLQAVLEALMQEHAVEGEEAPDGVGMVFLHLKTVLDCLDRAAATESPAQD